MAAVPSLLWMFEREASLTCMKTTISVVHGQLTIWRHPEGHAQNGFRIERNPYRWPVPRWPVRSGIGDLECNIVPMWLLIATVAIPTAFLWYRDRRPPPGRCRRCGYDLTGNVSGRCPECGERINRNGAVK